MKNLESNSIWREIGILFFSKDFPKLKKKYKNVLTYLKCNEHLISDPEDMANHAFSYFTNIFCFVADNQDLSMVNKVIPPILDSSKNHFSLVSHPSVK